MKQTMSHMEIMKHKFHNHYSTLISLSNKKKHTKYFFENKKKNTKYIFEKLK